ncbi:mobile sperm domain-containing protein [Candidatus Methanodesulfokora washburnensis]|uniref:Uncharacterized protein n=1 Tax=Candidatus Methanodesulfokora washburnensis TaxID=2478471 RepID=A0A3R9QHU1_9CREN|nr:mobile sperm domain-containing protein [Candidatus Methanodesulfokores washburnensis]RSN76881.1 hypothetical protein D6D85_03425 [Candidatus Methanodesulfokores washburnensis]
MDKRVFILILLLVPVFPASAEDISFSPPSGSSFTAFTNETVHRFYINVTTAKAWNITVDMNADYVNTTNHITGSCRLPVDLNVKKAVNSGVLSFYARLVFTNNNTTVTYYMDIDIVEPSPPGSLSFSPPYLSKSVAQGKQEKGYVTVKNNYQQRVEIKSITAPSWVTVDPASFFLEPSAEYTVAVTFSAANMNLGNYSDFLTFNYVVSGYSSVYRTKYQVRMTVVPPPAPSSYLCRVSITVLDSDSLQGIPDALVQLGDNFIGRTGGTGLIVFQNVPNGNYQLSVMASGYTTYVTNLEVKDTNTSKVVFMQKRVASSTSTSSSNATSVEKGVIGLPYATVTLKVDYNPVVKYIVADAESGPVGPVRIVPSMSIPNWISLRLNESKNMFNDGDYFVLELTVRPPDDVPAGTYTRQFMILGGKSPAQLNVNVILRNSTNSSTAVLAAPLGGQSESAASTVPGTVPRIIMKKEDGTAIPVNQLITVENGTLVYLMIKGDYTKVNVTWTGGIALFDDSYGGGMRTITLQILGNGDVSTFLVSRDEYGNVIRTQPASSGFGVFHFQVNTRTQPAKSVLVSVNPVHATVGKDVEISAFLVFYTQGVPTTAPYNGAVIVTTPSGEAIPVPLGLSGHTTFTPTREGTYTIGVSGLPLAAESVKQFDARAAEIPGSIYAVLKVGESYTGKWPAKFASAPKCWVDPTNAVREMNCNPESYVIVPAVAGSVFTVYGRGILASAYDVYPAGSEVTFALQTQKPVENTAVAFLQQGISAGASFLSNYVLIIVIVSAILMLILLKRRGIGALRGRTRLGG